jgi:hypothetical protein
MGKISEKGIMKEGYKKPCPASKTRFGIIITKCKMNSNNFKKFFLSVVSHSYR